MESIKYSSTIAGGFVYRMEEWKPEASYKAGPSPGLARTQWKGPHDRTELSKGQKSH